jgi:hypothetical protein
LFALETVSDVRLVGRALRDKWDVNRQKIKSALMTALNDPDLMIDAAKVLMLADSLDAKREEIENKKQAKENEQRLRLLELARSVPATELARLASENGICSGPDKRGRASETASTDGEKASGRTRSRNTATKKHRKKT